MYIPLKKLSAFGLMEVLITVVILSVGLMGLASLQNKSIQLLQEGDNLVTASMLAKETANRLISNPYMLAQGRLGYLATDINGDIASAGGVPAWASDVLTNNPDITRCYSADNTESCYADGDTLSNSSHHINALTNMQLMDEVELRQLAWNILPQGEIKICFDTVNPTTDWDCNNTASRLTARNENVFTVKVRWNNIFTNTPQIYVQQFTAECTNNASTHCGN